MRRWAILAAVLLGGYVFVAHGGWFVVRWAAAHLAPGQARAASDYYQFWAAARDYRAGRSIYCDLHDSWPAHANSLGRGDFGAGSVLPVNAYPPFATLLFLPLSYLDYADSYDLWLWLSVAMVLAAVVVIVAELGGAWSWPRKSVVVLLTLAAVAGSASLKHELQLGNVGSSLLLLVTLAWAAERRGYAAAAGGCAAVAFLVKLFPGVLLVYFWFVNRRAFWWTLGSSAVLAAAALLAFGWDDHVRFVRNLPRSEVWYGYHYNHSASGYWYRLLGRTWVEDNSGFPPVVPLATLPSLAKGLSVATAVVALAPLLLLGRRVAVASRSAKDALFAATLAGMLLASPISWPASLLPVIPALAILLHLRFGRGAIGWMVAAVALVLWASPSLVWEWRLRPDPSAPYTARDGLTHLAFKTYALSLLSGLALWTALRESRVRQPEATASIARESL